MEALKSRATNEELIHLKCPIHNYFGIGQNTIPTKGCLLCSKVQILTILATKGGDMNDNLSHLEAILHGACELDAEGKFDYIPEKPKFHLDKGNS